MSSYEASLRAAVFIDHLSKRPGIQPARTNVKMIHALFTCHVDRKPGVTYYRCGIAACVTRTLKEWVLWTDQPVTVITSHPLAWRELKSHRVSISQWDNPLAGLYARFTLLDSPFEDFEHRRSARAYDFEHWLRSFPHPAFYADQRVY